LDRSARNIHAADLLAKLETGGNVDGHRNSAAPSWIRVSIVWSGATGRGSVVLPPLPDEI
jgi:hypothetical protein